MNSEDIIPDSAVVFVECRVTGITILLRSETLFSEGGCLTLVVQLQTPILVLLDLIVIT